MGPSVTRPSETLRKGKDEMSNAKEYNPLEHSVVQSLLKADACNRYEVDRNGFVACLIFGIISELERVYWNIKQEQLKDREDWRFLEVPGLEYRRYCWNDCDCGADSPVHDKECPYVRDHYEWNKGRLDAISDKTHTDEEIEAAKARGADMWEIMSMCSSTISFDPAREAAYEKEHPHPVCNCGAEKDWKPRDHHLETCSPTLPNMAFGEVRINWYKYPCRGTSCNVDWDERQWRVWFDSAILALQQWEWDNESYHYGQKRPS